MEQKLALRSALAHAVGTLCEGELAMEPTAVATLSLVVEEYAKTLAVDLPAFAKHAKRVTISVDDVLLLTRGRPDLAAHLTEFAKDF